MNGRTDEYGGTLENRVRLVRELIEETREAVGDRCAVAVRFSADGHGDAHLSGDEARDVLGMLGDLPDLWDLVVADYYGEEMATSRFVKEASLEAKVAYAKRLTRKPVVSVGRFTSPDTMLRQVRSGILDFIGAARPSIADPFLPTKIRGGPARRHSRMHRLQHLLLLQLPRRRDSLHPESDDGRGMAPRLASGTRDRGRRRLGADRRRRPGGPRSRPHPRQARLCGDAGRLQPARPAAASRWKAGCRASPSGPACAITVSARSSAMPRVSMYLGSALTAADVREFGADHVLIATGARWRRDGVGRWNPTPHRGRSMPNPR